MTAGLGRHADTMLTSGPKSVFIVPGDHFGMDHYLRIGFGLPGDCLRGGLDRIHELIVKLQG
jgi:aspartate/methionine/tyrosine aminotransferase